MRLRLIRSLSLHQPQLLILSLASLTPFRGLIFAPFFLCISFCLGSVHCTRIMLSRRIDCHYFQGNVADIEELMLGTCGNNDNIALLNLLLFPSDNSLSLAVGEDERLIDSVNLTAH